jgi:Arc/MetJ family transcription regulator
MTFTRLTITLPEDLVARVRRCAHARGFSSYLASAAREKLLREDKTHIKKKLGEAYAQAAEEDRIVVSEWDAVIGDGL